MYTPFLFGIVGVDLTLQVKEVVPGRMIGRLDFDNSFLKVSWH